VSHTELKECRSDQIQKTVDFAFSGLQDTSHIFGISFSIFFILNSRFRFYHNCVYSTGILGFDLSKIATEAIPVDLILLKCSYEQKKIREKSGHGNPLKNGGAFCPHFYYKLPIFDLSAVAVSYIMIIFVHLL